MQRGHMRQRSFQPLAELTIDIAEALRLRGERWSCDVSGSRAVLRRLDCGTTATLTLRPGHKVRIELSGRV